MTCTTNTGSMASAFATKSKHGANRVFMCERQYTSINRAWAAANRMGSTYSNVFFTRVKRL